MLVTDSCCMNTKSVTDCTTTNRIMSFSGATCWSAAGERHAGRDTSSFQQQTQPCSSVRQVERCLICGRFVLPRQGAPQSNSLSGGSGKEAISALVTDTFALPPVSGATWASTQRCLISVLCAASVTLGACLQASPSTELYGNVGRCYYRCVLRSQ